MVRLYPDLPTEGHLLICDAEWLSDDVMANSPKLPFVRILIDVADVKFVEFVSGSEEISNAEPAKSTDPTVGKEGRGESETAGQPTGTSAATAEKDIVINRIWVGQKLASTDVQSLTFPSGRTPLATIALSAPLPPSFASSSTIP